MNNEITKQRIDTRAGKIKIHTPTDNILEIEVYDNDGTLVDTLLYSNSIELKEPHINVLSDNIKTEARQHLEAIEKHMKEIKNLRHKDNGEFLNCGLLCDAEILITEAFKCVEQ